MLPEGFILYGSSVSIQFVHFSIFVFDKRFNLVEKKVLF